MACIANHLHAILGRGCVKLLWGWSWSESGRGQSQEPWLRNTAWARFQDLTTIVRNLALIAWLLLKGFEFRVDIVWLNVFKELLWAEAVRTEVQDSREGKGKVRSVTWSKVNLEAQDTAQRDSRGNVGGKKATKHTDKQEINSEINWLQY